MRRFLGVAFVAACAAQAFALLPTVIYSTIQTSPTSDVPGIPGLKFDNDTTGFGRPYRSANGQNWVIEVGLNTATTTDDEAIMLGSGAAGALVVREGDQAPWAAAGELVGPIREKMQVNDSGHYAFGQNLAGTAPTDRDEQIVTWNGAFGVAAAEGGAVPGIAGENYGTGLTGASLTNAGVVGFHAPSTVGALPTTQDDVIILNNAVVAQSGIAGTPTNQLASQMWSTFATDDLQVSADGTKWMTSGTLTTPTTSDSVLAVNNAVVLQESQPIAGLTANLASIQEAIMTSDGDWFARGETAGDVENFVMRNGVVLAKKGDLVPGGLPGETFSDAVYDALFFTMAGNANGDFVYGGLTSNADPEFDAVLVLNNASVLARQGDPVDVDGNGLFDDNAYLDVFNNEDAFLTNDGWYYFTAELRDDASVTIGQAFLRVAIPEPSTIGLLLVGLAGLLRRR